MKVNLSRLQIVSGIAYHAGEREVPEAVATELKRRGALIEPKPEPEPKPAKTKAAK